MQNNVVIQKKFMWTVKGPNKFWTKANENCYLLHNQSTQSVQRYFDHFQFQSPVDSWYLKKNSWNDKSRNESCDSISRKNNIDLQKNSFGQWKVRTNFESKHTKIATFHTISSKVFRSLSVSVADKFMMSKKIFKMKLGFFREITQILQV